MRSGQVLLTADDLMRRAHYRNAQRTLDRLLGLGVLPVVNENDTVATDEIRFGDNDRLAALVAHVVRADVLVLLSDVDGLYDGDPRRPGPAGSPRSRHPRPGRQILAAAPRRRWPGAAVARPRGRHRRHGHQGRRRAARDQRRHPGRGRPADQAAAALAGEPVGTYFAPGTGGRPPAALAGPRRRRPRGRLQLDAGPSRGGRQAGSLLPAGRHRRRGRLRRRVTRSTCDESGPVSPAAWSTTTRRRSPG